MATGAAVCLPPLPLIQRVISKMLEEGGGATATDSTLAQATLVRRLDEPFNGPSLEDFSIQGCAQPGVAHPSGLSVAPVDRLEIEQRVLSADNISATSSEPFRLHSGPRPTASMMPPGGLSPTSAQIRMSSLQPLPSIVSWTFSNRDLQ